MSLSIHPIIVPSYSDIEDAFSSTNVPDYFPATPRNTSPDSSNDLTKYILATLVFSPLHDDPYMEIMQAYDATDDELPIPPLQAPIVPPTEISPPKYIETPVESPIPISPSSLVGSSSPVRMPPKRMSTSEAPAMTQAAIKKLVADSVSAALEAQATTMVVLCPNMVPNPEKLLEAFIGGLPRSIKGNVTASKPQTLEEAITITQRLMDQVTKHNSEQGTNNHKQKFDDERNTTDNDNYPNNRNKNNQDNHNNNNRNNDHHQQQNRRQETFKAYTANNGYTGNCPFCKRCTLHHIGPCTIRCQTCNKVGHLTRNCRNKGPATRNNLQSVSITCNTCGEKGHYPNQCSKANNRAIGDPTY
ncbi:reverse transcriptase domain-containing protein, partial [Tanacetum coccineum]